MNYKKLVYVDMDDTLCDYKSAIKARRKFIQYPQSKEGFFLNLEPLPNAISSMKKFLEDEKIEVYILTAPSVMNPMSYMEKRQWVEKHLGMEYCQRLIICPNKGLLKGDILIDDLTEGKGQEDFEGELIQIGNEMFPNWNTIMDYLY
jgi:5'-nucleotidase